jgi:hypothetical protein
MDGCWGIRKRVRDIEESNSGAKDLPPFQAIVFVVRGDSFFRREAGVILGATGVKL